MTNAEFTDLLRNVAAAYAIKNEKKHYFQIIAYQKAADAIEASTSEVTDLYNEGRLDAISGLGKSMREHIAEIVETGKSNHFEHILSQVPNAVFPLLDIPSFGPKKAYKLVSIFHLTAPDTVIYDVWELAKKGEIAKIDGFGEKSQNDILQAIDEYNLGVNKSSRMVLPYASEIADKIVSYMKQCKDVLEVEPLGSLRRRKETIGDVDIAISTRQPEAVLGYFVQYPYKDRILERGEATASILIRGGKHIDLMVQPPESFGSLLQHFTGSKEHNIKLREYALKKGLSLSEYGIKDKTAKDAKMKKYQTEESFYKALGLSFIPPEIRENKGEIELAKTNTLPKLVEHNDIKGDFHLHSSFLIEPSHDLGQDTIETMVKKAQSLGYHSVGFSEHNPSIKGHTQEKMAELVLKRNKEIDHVQKSYKNVRIYKLLETDILPSGGLAINNSVFENLDATLVSVHSSFSMNTKDMTERVLKGLSHKKAKILSHPTGRLINQRNGYDINWNELFSFCKKENKALEINSSPYRLDLRDTLVYEAVKQGVLLIINTDSHAAAQMDLMRFGVDVAKRGWATKDNIINTWSQDKIQKWLTQS